MKTFNIALVGCGTISYNHLTALRELDNVNVVALCDIKPERFSGISHHRKTDASLVVIERNPDKCVLCGTCFNVCHKGAVEKKETALLD